MKKTTRFGATFALLALSVLFTGCDKKDANNSSGNQSPAPADSIIADSKIYIDSVPSGAEVYLLPADEKSKEDKLLGKTPLAVESSECPSRKFLVSMNMEYYLKQIEQIPELKEWAKEFKSSQYFGDTMMSQDFFTFDVPESIMTTNLRGGLIAIGPRYKLDRPEKNRICAMFIPKGKKVSLFYPLMSPPDTFKGFSDGNWDETMRNYRFSEEQIKEAVGCLSRCGKFTARVRDPFRDKMAKQYVITAQGGNSEMVIVTHYDIELIPGYNDL